MNLGAEIGQIVFAPLIPWPLLWGALGVAVLALVLAVWRRLSGWWLRGLTAAVLLLALANPSIQTEDRTPLSDIVLLVTDHSSSQKIGDRPQQTAAAEAAIKAKLKALPDTEVREVSVGDAPGDGGTLMMGALSDALAEEPRARVAGAILITDGQIGDMAQAPDFPAPVNVLLTGHKGDWDRRLIVKDAPAYAIMGEPVKLTLEVSDQGAVPAGAGKTAMLEISIDGGKAQSVRVPVGKPLDLPVTLPHGGMNVLQFNVPAQKGELTDRNNAAVVQINGVRDRLRVLLVSGEPHTGERVWRNLLKSDPSVDLVHFTILRPPEKQDGVPVSELSLIAFPTRELFVEKIKDFDLIIFDRYRRRGILPAAYLQNVKNYVEQGGAVLVSAGPEFGSADSLWRSPLGSILPVVPTSQVLVGGFKPEITKLGDRHPVTEGLAAFGPKPKPGETGPGWGRWFRQVEVKNRGGQVLMTGYDHDPLLILKREGKGRGALLASDEAWLWSRGYEGGGPQLELLRRLAHWLMKEPELEEEALTATSEGAKIQIVRRSLSEGHDRVTITGPDGKLYHAPLKETEPGRFPARWVAPDMGLYRLEEGGKKAVVAVGPSAPKEFEETIATPAKLQPLLAVHRGGAHRIEDGIPDIRRVSAGRAASGRGWIGITPRHAYVTRDLRVSPLLPAWAFLLLAAVFALGAWLREGRR